MMASKIPSRNWNCFIFENGLPSLSNAKRSFLAICCTRGFSLIGWFTSGLASDSESIDWFENIIVPSSSGSLCRSMRGDNSSSMASLKVSNMISLISLVMASRSACVATPAAISSLPNATMQS